MSTSGVSGSSVDSSAAAWQAQTIAAAESYAEAQAAEAARQRDLASSTDGQYTQDGVDNSPSAAERAQAAFQGHDPAPTGVAPAGGRSASNGPAADGVKLTAQEVAALQSSGLTVKAAGNGTYFIEAPGASLNLVEEAPPPPPPTAAAIPLPGASPSTVQSRHTEAPPPAPEPAAAETSAPNKAGRPSIKDALEELLRHSPTMRQQWLAAQKAGWTIDYHAPPGKGQPAPGTKAYPDHKQGPRILIDPAAVKGSLTNLNQLISHEIGHVAAGFPREIPKAGLSKEEYVQRNVAQALDKEGAATFENVRHAHEVRQSGGPPLEIAGRQDRKYEQIYADYEAGRITEQEAKTRMGSEYGHSERLSGDGRTYAEAFRALYEAAWSHR